MRAVVATKFGSADHLRLQEVERPTPGEKDVLIRVHAATVTAGDVMVRRLPFAVWLVLRVVMGLKRKRIPGYELAGEVEGVGKDVTLFSVGDRVFGTTTGLSAGANTEYVCLPEVWEGGVLARMPENASYEQAAAVPVGGMTALFLLRKGNIQSGQKVLVNGASGSVGTYAVQLAKHFGAEVTGVCSGRNVEMVKSLGADKVIDYTQEDVTESGEHYDLVFDAVGKLPRSDATALLREGGTFVSVQSTTHESLENLIFLRGLLETGAIRAVIDRRFPLAQTAEAHRYVETGHKAGNVVIGVAT